MTHNYDQQQSTVTKSKNRVPQPLGFPAGLVILETKSTQLLVTLPEIVSFYHPNTSSNKEKNWPKKIVPGATILYNVQFQNTTW